MGEQTPPLAVYPAPKQNRPPRRGLSAGLQRAIFLALGVVIGGSLVAIAIRAMQPESRIVYRAPASGTQPKVDSSGQPNLKPPGDPTDLSAASTVPKDPAASKEPIKPTDPGKSPETQPFNPFDGNLSSPVPQKEITGHISPGAGVQLPLPTGTGAPQTPAAEPVTPKGLLVVVRLDVSDPNGAVKALQAVAAREGGSAIQFDEMAAKPDAEGAVVFVPAAKADETEKQIGSVGSVIVSDRWTGSASDRLDRIEQTAVDHLSDLHVKRQELLIKYFDDAPQIKHIDEDSDRINKCLAALRSRKSDSGMAVIKIKFLS